MDVTRRVEAEQALALARSALLERSALHQRGVFLQALLDARPIGVTLVDEGLRVALANQACAALLAVGPELLNAGSALRDIYRVQADRGELGPGDSALLVEQQFVLVPSALHAALAGQRSDGAVLDIRSVPCRRGRQPGQERVPGHDEPRIRTPLNADKGLLELPRLSSLDAEQRDTVDTVRESSKSLLRLIDVVLDFSKIESGRPQILQVVIATADAMHQTLRASHAELIDARRSLSAIEVELTESRKLLEKDPLTGTDNRRAMAIILELEIARARCDREPMAVALVDIDHFKKINDQHGHAAGDAALVHLTQLARAILRGNDAFIRYGGEEFLLVIAETSANGAVHVATS